MQDSIQRPIGIPFQGERRGMKMPEYEQKTVIRCKAVNVSGPNRMTPCGCLGPPLQSQLWQDGTLNPAVLYPHCGMTGALSSLPDGAFPLVLVLLCVCKGLTRLDRRSHVTSWLPSKVGKQI
ncbi:hypothetical protein STEG23_005708, partial [Scotinomys teguina]